VRRRSWPFAPHITAPHRAVDPTPVAPDWPSLLARLQWSQEVAQWRFRDEWCVENNLGPDRPLGVILWQRWTASSPKSGATCPPHPRTSGTRCRPDHGPRLPRRRLSQSQSTLRSPSDVAARLTRADRVILHSYSRQPVLSAKQRADKGRVCAQQAGVGSAAGAGAAQSTRGGSCPPRGYARGTTGPPGRSGWPTAMPRRGRYRQRPKGLAHGAEKLFFVNPKKKTVDKPSDVAYIYSRRQAANWRGDTPRETQVRHTRAAGWAGYARQPAALKSHWDKASELVST
jgi:hypothetical protein